MIKVRNLNKSFNGNSVLDNLSFDVNDNKVFGLIGINGSGKSTLLRILAGSYQADSGNIFVDEILHEDKQITKSKIFYIPDDTAFTNLQTPKELGKFFSSFYDNFDNAQYYELLLEFSLNINSRVGSLSKGMKKRLYLALAIAANTKYILLDETFDGLDPLIRVQVKKIILSLVDNYDKTIIVASHSLRDLEDIVDEFLILDKNKVISDNIDNTIGKYIRYQLAYKDIVDETLFQKMNYISLDIVGRVVNITFDNAYDIDYHAWLLKTEPVIIEEIAVTFEDYFILSAKKSGYLG